MFPEVKNLQDEFYCISTNSVHNNTHTSISVTGIMVAVCGRALKLVIYKGLEHLLCNQVLMIAVKTTEGFSQKTVW